MCNQRCPHEDYEGDCRVNSARCPMEESDQELETLLEESYNEK